jgi:hypothetical protein
MIDDESRSTVPPLLEEVARRRSDLYSSIVALEEAAARPAVGREAAWFDLVRQKASDLRTEVDDHIQSTERADGLYAEILDTAPRLCNRIDLLRTEHRRMSTDAESLVHHLASAIPTGDTVATAREEIRSLLGLLVKHRQLGSDVVWEAFSVDVGGTG